MIQTGHKVALLRSIHSQELLGSCQGFFGPSFDTLDRMIHLRWTNPKTSEGAQLALRAFQGVSNQTNQVLVLALDCLSRHRDPLYCRRSAAFGLSQAEQTGFSICRSSASNSLYALRHFQVLMTGPPSYLCIRLLPLLRRPFLWPLPVSDCAPIRSLRLPWNNMIIVASRYIACFCSFPP